jgi:hypothetical protein
MEPSNDSLAKLVARHRVDLLLIREGVHVVE